MKTRNFWIGLLLLGAATAIGSPARVLVVTEKPPSGEVNIAIVFAPGSPQSAKEASDLQSMLGTGDVAAFLLTEGLGADGAKVAAADGGISFAASFRMMITEL